MVRRTVAIGGVGGGAGGGGSGVGGVGDVGDYLRGQGVVFVHEAEVGLEGRGCVGGGFWGFEHAGRVGGEVGCDGAG